MTSPVLGEAWGGLQKCICYHEASGDRTTTWDALVARKHRKLRTYIIVLHSRTARFQENWELVSLLNPTCAAFTSRKTHWGGAVLERVIGPISAWMGCFWHNGTRREIACEADQWLSLVNQKWPPKVQQFVILPLKLPVWGIPHVSKLSLNILNMIAKPQSHRCHRNYMNSALVAASIFREIAGTKPREQRWFPA